MSMLFMYLCGCVWGSCAQVCVHMQKPEEDVRRVLLYHFLPYCIDTGHVTSNLSVSTFVGYRHVLKYTAFYMGFQ